MIANQQSTPKASYYVIVGWACRERRGSEDVGGYVHACTHEITFLDFDSFCTDRFWTFSQRETVEERSEESSPIVFSTTGKTLMLVFIFIFIFIYFIKSSY